MPACLDANCDQFRLMKHLKQFFPGAHGYVCANGSAPLHFKASFLSLLIKIKNCCKISRMLVPFAGYILKFYLLLFIISDYERQFVENRQVSFDNSRISKLMHLANSISPLIYAKRPILPFFVH